MVVSVCCKESVGDGVRYEYPLGGTVWYEAYRVDYCECCGKECDTMEVALLENRTS